MDKKGYAQNLVDLSDLETEAAIPMTEESAPSRKLIQSMITKDPDFIDIFSDEMQQKRIQAEKKEQILIEEEKKGQDDKEDDNKAQSCWNIEYYMYFFEVDSKLFLHRAVSSLWPYTSKPFLHPQEEPNNISMPQRPAQPIVGSNKKYEIYKKRHDLYGALWIPTTLITILSLCSYTLHNDNNHITRLVSITYATYIFLFAFPLVLFGVVKLGVVGEDVHERAKQNKIGFYTLLCVYGYSFTPYLVPAVFSVLRFVLLKWSLIFLATFTALWMLNKEVGVLATLEEGQKMGRGILGMRILVTVTQLGYGLLMGFWFLG